jgi:NADPH2:quinone reductase
MTGSMRAARVATLDGPDAVEIQQVPEPTPSAGQVLVDVEYAGVAFPDLLQTRGQYQARPSLPFIPGWEVSGTVRTAALGLRPGDRVAALPMGGGFAECVAVDERMVFPLPGHVSFAQGAALPLNYLTAHLALVRRGGLRSGETLLVHGAAGGVGTAVCATGAALGARVIGVVSTAEKGAAARAAGAHDVVLADTFRDDSRRLTGGRGVDVVVDPVGGDRVTDSLRSLAVEGRLLVLGFAGGEIASVRTNRLLLANTSVMGAATRELWELEPDYPAVQWRALMALVDSGPIAPLIGAELPLAGAASALGLLDERRAMGKVLLRVR